MALTDGGTTPLDRYRERLNADLTCPECGFTDEDGAWQAETSGGRVHYRHVCPSCGVVDKRELRLK